MKKILVVLLVLAVAGGVFAQEGEWSFSGMAEFGAFIDFDPLPGEDGVAARSGYMQYNRMYDGWDSMKGSFGMNYSRDGFTAGLTIQSRDWGNFSGNFNGDLNYSGENFNFQVQAPLDEMLMNMGNYQNRWHSGIFNALWGNYTFLDGIFFLEVAYVRDAGHTFWESDRTGAFRNYEGIGNNLFHGDAPFKASLDGGGNTFTHMAGNREFDASNYIAGDIRLQGLSFGLLMRNIFRAGKAGDLPSSITGSTYTRAFVEEVLKDMVFGVKFEMSPIEIAAQILMRDYGVYLGGKWFVGPVTVGLSFMGILDPKVPDVVTTVTENEGIYNKPWDGVDAPYLKSVTYKSADITLMKVGGGVDYNADSFGAALKGYLAMAGNKNTDDGYISMLGVEPSFYYNVIPTHLQFALNAGFFFYSYYADGKEITDNVNNVQYALQPALFWNFLGTGAGGYWGHGTGICLRYRVVGGDPKKDPLMDLQNKFDVNFKWSF